MNYEKRKTARQKLEQATCYCKIPLYRGSIQILSSIEDVSSDGIRLRVPVMPDKSDIIYITKSYFNDLSCRRSHVPLVVKWCKKIGSSEARFEIGCESADSQTDIAEKISNWNLN